MATTVNVTSEFKGTLAGEIFVQAFKKADTIAKNCITVIPNVLGSGYLPKLEYSADFVAYACGWNPTGEIDYTDKEVIVKKYLLQHEICKNDFAQTFQAAALGLFGANSEIPATILDAILEAMIKNMGAKLDFQIWQGNGSANQLSGLLPQFVADATVVDVSGTTITAANVVAELAKVYAAIPEVLDIEDEDLVIVVSKNVAGAYRQAQASMGLNTTVGPKELDYLGMRMESIGGLPSNTILVYRVKNLGILTGFESDFNEVRIADDETRLDGIVRTAMAFTAGVGYSFGFEVVYYRP